MCKIIHYSIFLVCVIKFLFVFLPAYAEIFVKKVFVIDNTKYKKRTKS